MRNEKGEFEDNRLEDTYENKKLLVRLYFRWKINKTMRLAKLKKNDIILDFGCGGGWLEKKLKDYKIYGYDINPKKTFIKNYKDLKPTKIFALDVFEHINPREIKKILDNFKKMNDKFDLIVSVPTENWVSRNVRKLVGKAEVPAEHITKYHEIIQVLKKKFKLKRKINFFTISYILMFEYRKNQSKD